MKIYLGLLFALILVSSCKENPKYSDIATFPNYYDSLYNVSFLKEINPICLKDSFKMEDDEYSLNPYLRNGSQTINIFKELEASYQLDKPILIYFTAFGAINCRKMEQTILNDQKIHSFVDNEFIFIPLCVDDRTKLPEANWVKHPHKENAKPLNRIGLVNNYIQVVLSQSSGQPFFVVIDINSVLGQTEYINDKEEFNTFLEQSLKKYKENYKWLGM